MEAENRLQVLQEERKNIISPQKVEAINNIEKSRQYLNQLYSMREEIGMKIQQQIELIRIYEGKAQAINDIDITFENNISEIKKELAIKKQEDESRSSKK